MKILAIMGSPNKKGNTYKLTSKVEDHMKQHGNVEFEYIFLKDVDLQPCRGCGICFDKGEKMCPLKDDRQMLEEKIQKADGVIFTSPNYVFNVSSLMKNFIDRFAYVCHRPRFFKNALALSTSGVGGSKIMLMNLTTPLGIWGFNVVQSVGIVTNNDPTSDLSTPIEKVNKKVNDAAKKFYEAVKAGRPNPSIFALSTFIFAKRSIKDVDPKFYDYNYWNDHGWLQSDSNYYYDPDTNFFKKALANIFSHVMGLIEI